MKLTGLLKNKVEEAQTKEEKKAIIAEAGMELTDEELDGVAGGFVIGQTSADMCQTLDNPKPKR
ncbi:MAG: hypothetical protein MJZ11_09035 [Lachnospiraceae bacterium]|nr:hypothetical protein [Lachnospiraceae bacterium]